MSTSETSFLLVRHGRTLWNLEKRIQGRLDSPLAPEGERRVRIVRAALDASPPDRVLTSDLGRALATAEILNRRWGAPLTVDRRLREQDFGRWGGLRFAEIRKRDMDYEVAKGWEFRPPGGESRLEVLDRASKALLDAAATWPGDDILVTTHHGVIKSLLYFLWRDDYMPGKKKKFNPDKGQRVAVRDGRLVPAETDIAFLPDR